MSEEYYGVPLLKQPKWGWEIAAYFFLEGLSAGSLLLATLADRNESPPRFVRYARWIAFGALLPCPPLLIADLGRPERFHHMLRVFKPASPMNFGAWALLSYSVPATVAGAAAWLPARFVRSVSLAGVPSMLAMLSYPGVLLETTSTPIWSQTNFAGPLLAASSLNSAAALLSAIDPRSKALARIETLTAGAEIAAALGYAAQAKRALKPLTGALPFWAGLVCASLLIRNRRWKAIFALGGSLLLKFAVTYGGRKSAQDLKATRDATRPTRQSPGWRALPEPAADQHQGDHS
jgi:formate-dependent nitrite reductase membrane component NrfD